MDRVLDDSLNDITDVALVRPAAIWLGLSSFLIGSIFLGGALAGAGAVTAEGPLFMLLGVALIGGGFTMKPTGFEYDAGLEFSGMKQYAMTAISGLFVAISSLLLVVSLL
jgi:hypothetical protein